MSDYYLYSLSGYLTLKNKLTILHINHNKSLWFVLNETLLQLESYLNEKEFHQKSMPMHQISLVRSAIVPSLVNESEFVILTENEKYELKAENNESLMVWIRELQKKRNNFYRKDAFVCDAINDEYQIEEEDDLAEDSEDTLSTSSTLSNGSNNKKYLNDKNFNSADKKLEPPTFPRRGSFRNQLKSIESFDSMKLVEINQIRRQSLNRYKLKSIESIDSAFYDKMTNSDEFPVSKGNRFLEKEIMKLKTELALSKDKESEYEKDLTQKDEQIDRLKKQIMELNKKNDEKTSKTSNDKIKSENEILKNEIILVNSILNDDEAKFQLYTNEIKSLKTEINRLKIDYLNILQSFLASSIENRLASISNDAASISNLSFSSMASTSKSSCKSIDTYYSTEPKQVVLFGGDKHKRRLKELLEECRRKDPTLPSWESITSNEFFVDKYGFKYNKANENLLIHYICQQLNLFYDSQPKVHEDSLWRARLNEWKKLFLVTKDVKCLIRNGIMPKYRTEVWKMFINRQVADIKKSKGPNYYLFLCNLINELPKDVIKFNRQIYLDLLRTLPNNVKFSTKYSQGVNQLQEVLQAFCLHNPSIGYCQGMNFIVGISLLFLEPEDTFWCLVAITEKFFLPHYFDTGLVGAQADQKCLQHLLELKIPELHDHLEQLEIDLSSITLNWFLAIFIDALPFETMLRIWDCFLLEGTKILFRFSIALLSSFLIFKSLKYAVKYTFDVDGLTKIAFDGLRPFPKRKEIVFKQRHFLKVLREKWKDQHLVRMSQHRIQIEEHNLNENDETDEKLYRLKIDCCNFVDERYIWISYGGQTEGNLIIGDINAKKMSVHNIMTESKIVCLVCLDEFNLVIMALLSGFLMAYHSKTKECLWSLKLKDSILHMLLSKGQDSYRLYCGLSNGNITYIEINSSLEPTEIYDIIISNNPINYIELVTDNDGGKYLWVASANMIHVINEVSLLNETKFEVSLNIFDHVLMLCNSRNGVLASIKGSSIIHLYDIQTYQCKLLYDVKLNMKLNVDKENDFSYNQTRITSFMPFENLVWIGTGDGYLFIYSLDSFKLRMNPRQKRFSITSQLLKRRESRRHFASDFSSIQEEKPKILIKKRDFSLPCFRIKKVDFDLRQFRKSRSLSDLKEDINWGKYMFPKSEKVTFNLQHRMSIIEEPGNLDYRMDLVTKAKISDQPVRNILCKSLYEEDFVITCSGNYGDDETVLKWTRNRNGSWRNDPFIEVCSLTNIPRRPLYAKIEYFQKLKNRKQSYRRHF